MVQEALPSLNYGTAAIFVPASTLGAGLVYLPSENLTISSLLVSGTPCTHGGCFDDLNDKGGISINEVIYQYEAGGLPGGFTGSFMYLFDMDFETLDGILPVPGPPGWEGSPKKDDSWIVGGSSAACVIRPRRGLPGCGNRKRGADYLENVYDNKSYAQTALR